MRLVVIESPFRGATPADQARNERYLEACIADCLQRGESPYASHKMLTRVLDDADFVQRELGMNAGFAWATRADTRAVYTDLGISIGMRRGIEHAAAIGHVVEYRKLGGEWSKA